MSRAEYQVGSMRFDQRIFYMASPALNRELATSELVEAATLSISDNKVFSKMLLYVSLTRL